MEKRKLYHGADGDKISVTLKRGVLFPDSNNEIYFDYSSYASCFVHGADSKRKKSFVLGVEVDLEKVHYVQTSRSGNPTTLIVTTTDPLPVTIVEMYVRTGRADDEEGFSVQRITGLENMKHHL